MRIRNKDIAEALGISTTAVSLAINNKPGVSEETRLKVMQLISDYADLSVKEITVPAAANSRAILLSIHKKHGEIINDKPFFSDLIETVQQEAMKRSYALNVAHYVPGQSVTEYIRYIDSFPVDGIIVLGTEMEEEDFSYYQRLDKPTVLLDASFPLLDVDAVVIDNQSSILREFEYAYRQGHRDFGYLRSSLWISNFQRRYDGFLKGVADYHLENGTHPVIELPCSIEGAYEKMAAYLAELPEGGRLPTVFLADLDYIAVGAVRALKDAGYRVPEDVSVIGYDDLPICLVSEPNLTSTRVNQFALGRIAVDRLVDLMSFSTDYCTVTEVASELVVRDSVKNIRKKKKS